MNEEEMREGELTLDIDEDGEAVLVGSKEAISRLLSQLLQVPLHKERGKYGN